MGARGVGARGLVVWALLCGCGETSKPEGEASDAAEVPAADVRATTADAPAFETDAWVVDGTRDLGASADGAQPTDLVALTDVASADDVVGAADARPAVDVGEPTDATRSADASVVTPCAVDGVAGTCLDVSDCPDDHHPTPGHCPGPVEVQCCTPNPEAPPGVCDPARRVRPAPYAPEAPGAPGCPAGMARVAAFCVDQYEAALLEVFDDGHTEPASPYHTPQGRRVRAVSVAGAVPQGYIDGLAAEAACLEAGKRLCTNEEWLRACQGPDGTTYPYGDARQPGVCNDARALHPAVEAFPDDPTPFDRIQDACINQLPETVALTGSHPGCLSAEGLFDLMGNLHEWTSDPEGTFRGGFYVDTAINGPGCLYRTTAHDRAHWDYSTGFRCCADAAR
jgi:hypothetical protein